MVIVKATGGTGALVPVLFYATMLILFENPGNQVFDLSLLLNTLRQTAQA